MSKRKGKRMVWVTMREPLAFEIEGYIILIHTLQRLKDKSSTTEKKEAVLKTIKMLWM